MQVKKFSEKDYAICINYGEDVMEKLAEFANEYKIGFCCFNGVGAFKETDLGAFNATKCEFIKHKVVGNQDGNDFTLEVISFIGNITWDKKTDTPIVHAHSAVSDKTGAVKAGHVFKGVVGVTFELSVRVVSPKVKHYRQDDKQFNFRFWDLDSIK